MKSLIHWLLAVTAVAIQAHCSNDYTIDISGNQLMQSPPTISSSGPLEDMPLVSHDAAIVPFGDESIKTTTCFNYHFLVISGRLAKAVAWASGAGLGFLNTMNSGHTLPYWIMDHYTAIGTASLALTGAMITWYKYSKDLSVKIAPEHLKNDNARQHNLLIRFLKLDEEFLTISGSIAKKIALGGASTFLVIDTLDKMQILSAWFNHHYIYIGAGIAALTGLTAGWYKCAQDARLEIEAEIALENQTIVRN